MSYRVSLANFEGPFALLFHLIEQAEIDIYDIPIGRIAQEYLDYLTQLEELDLDSASEFLLMAAKLLEIKSKLLLPTAPPVNLGGEQEDEDPREELAIKLVRYKQYRDLARFLAQLASAQEAVYTRPPTLAGVGCQEDAPLVHISPKELARALCRVLASRTVRQLPSITEKKVGIAQQTEFLVRCLSQNKTVYFQKLFSSANSRLEIIATFLALLELIHQGRAKVYQGQAFGQIMIAKCGEWQ